MLMWASLYMGVPRSRAAMLCASVGLAHSGIFLEYWYLRDYWSPEYMLAISIGGVVVAVEDYLFGFAMVGLAAGLFELVSGDCDREARSYSLRVSWMRLQTIAGLFLLSMFLLCGLLRIESVPATILTCLVGSAAVLRKHSTWMRGALLTGCAMTTLFWLFYEICFLRLYPTIIEDWWNHAALTGIRLGAVPLEELAWAFAMGLFIGPVVRGCSAQIPDGRAVAGVSKIS